MMEGYFIQVKRYQVQKIKFQLQFHYCSRGNFFTGTVELNLNEKSNLIGTMTFVVKC